MSDAQKKSAPQEEPVPDIVPAEIAQVTEEQIPDTQSSDASDHDSEPPIPEEKPALILVKFIAPYKIYSPDDISGFDTDTAQQLISKRYAVEYQKE